ncbi:MAG TPA: carboxypeptidase regulatory-like domain-containing protein [Clostridia bacterium]|nr:carboxypeptidase regulatory-like domain-containing protein [Clostridia bacterium]
MSRQRNLQWIAFLIIVLLASAPWLSAQSDSATLSGTVLDQTEAIVTNVKVTVMNTATAVRRSAVTDRNGTFAVPLLSPGTYKVIAERDGFAPAEINNIVLNAADQKLLRIRLKVGATTEMVKVEATADMIETSSAVGTVIDRKFVENTPLNGRSFQSLLLMTPGAVMGSDGDGQMSINGQRTNSNAYIIDGVSANVGIQLNRSQRSNGAGGYASIDTTLGGNTPAYNSFGGTNGMLSVDALQEFKVQSSTFSAEYGRQPGGQVQMTSRSGENQFHGTVSEYFRNDVLDARNWFVKDNQKKPALRQNNFGFTVGGPIIKDKTFFFASYEGLRLMLPQNSTKMTVPSTWLRDEAGLTPQVKAILNSFPLPNGPDNLTAQGVPSGSAPFTYTSSSARNMDNVSVRVDHALNSKVTIFGRYNRAPSNSEGWSGNQRGATEMLLNTLTLGTNAVISNNITNEFRANYSHNKATGLSELTNLYNTNPVSRDALLPSFAGDLAQVTVSVLGGSFQIGPNREAVQRQYNFVDNLSVARGHHLMKFGADYRYVFPKTAPRNYGLSLTLGSLANIRSSLASGGITANESVVAVYENFSIYGQDTWRVAPRLTLDYGMRWDYNPAPHGREDKPLYTVSNIDDLPNVALAPAGTELYPSIKTGFGPRIGAAYELNTTRGWETVVRGGYGIYYDLGAGTAGLATEGFPYTRMKPVGATTGTAVPYPFTEAQLQAPPTLSLTPPYKQQMFNAVDPDYHMPRSYQWTLSLQQSLGKDQSLTVSWVGNSGKNLLRRYMYNVGSVNTDFGGTAQSSRLSVTRSNDEKGDTSDYNSMQIQFQRRMSRGLQVMSNYTWSHAIDTGSSDWGMNDEYSSSDPMDTRASSSFDRRHIFNTVVSYEFPKPSFGSSAFAKVGNGLLSGWATDWILKYESGTPMDVTFLVDPSPYLPSGYYMFRADRVEGVPMWVDSPSAASGKVLNAAAFDFPSIVWADATKKTLGDPSKLTHGNVGRNSVRNLGAFQFDFAIRREFTITKRAKLQFKSEFFNILNHPNFAPPSTQLGNVFYGWGFSMKNSTFGQTTSMRGQGNIGGLDSFYQLGGPRSIQFAAKIVF